MAPSEPLRYLLNSTIPGQCNPNSAFVTIVANETYVGGALCLLRSLTRVRSACPLKLIVADPLPSTAMDLLAAEFDRSAIYKLSDLRRRLTTYQQQQQQQQPGSATPSGRRLASTQKQPLTNTRQLKRAQGWARRTHQKLLVFALHEYQRAAYLDIDMLVTKNVDALLEQEPFAAVAALPYSTKSFNSGVFVFQPSLSTAAALDDLSQRATFSAKKGSSPGLSSVRIGMAGERFELSDQSILNHHFKSSWRRLPFGYNLGVKVKQVTPKKWDLIDWAVVHFVHRPKPWEPTLADPESPMSKLALKLGIDPLVRAWRWRCAGEPKPARYAAMPLLTPAERALWEEK